MPVWLTGSSAKAKINRSDNGSYTMKGRKKGSGTKPEPLLMYNISGLKLGIAIILAALNLYNYFAASITIIPSIQ